MKADWKLHKHTCKMHKLEDLGFEMAQLDVRGRLTNSEELQAVWVP
jgi:hypothetical protein